MKTSPLETSIRAAIMLGVVAGGGWYAWRHTRLPEVVHNRLDGWLVQQDALQPTGGDAPPWAGDTPDAPPPFTVSAAAPLWTEQESQEKYPLRQAGHLVPADEQAAPSNRAGPSQYAQIEARLRELGAVYTLLESWGRDGENYRFMCRVSRAGEGGLSRTYEASAATPSTAMREVLRQVEQWRFGGAAPRGLPQ